MPRPKTIQGQKRVEIFLEYRRRGKVFPVAKHYRIARSTVAGIVREFTAQGFSESPRAKMSPGLLAKLQQGHIEEVRRSIINLHELPLQGPKENMYGNLEARDLLEGKSSDDMVHSYPLGLGEAVTWHLIGSEAGNVVAETREALMDYDRQCAKLWGDIKESLEHACHLPVRRDPSPAEAAILPALVDTIYRQAFAARSRDVPEQPFEPRWFSSGEERSHLAIIVEAAEDLTDRIQVAYGDATIREQIKGGVASVLRNQFNKFCLQAQELALLHHDLHYIRDALLDTIRRVPQEHVERNICPQCPYPEVITSSEKQAEGDAKEDVHG